MSIDNETNQVSVEGHEIGELNGFSFRVEAAAAPEEQKTLQAAAETALQAELTRRAKLFANVGYKTLSFDFSEGLAHPKIMWEGAPIATVHDSGALFGPRVKLVASSLLQGESADLVVEKTQEWLDTRIAEKLEPLIKLAQELNGETEAPEGAAPLSGLARGVAYRLLENYGVMKRTDVDGDLRQLDQDARKGLRRFGIRIGASSLYIPLVLKPHAIELRLMMWAMGAKLNGLPGLPTPGMVWVETEATAPNAFYELAGFTVVGKKAVRMDMLERLADAVRPLGQGGDWFEVTPEIMGLVGLSGEDFAEVMASAGYKHEVRKVPAPAKDEAAKEEAAKEEAPKDEAPTEAAPEADKAEEAPAEVPAEEAKPEEASAEAPVEEAKLDEAPADVAAPEGETAAEGELVERYFFAWAPKRKARPQGGRPQGDRKPGGSKPQGKGGDRRGKGKGAKPSGPRTHTARPPKREKQADPDSPFAALAGLKDALQKKK